MHSRLATRFGMACAGLMMAAGLAFLNLSAAAPAAAGSCTSPNGGAPCSPAIPVSATASTATVSSSTTLTLSTTAITFPNATTLPTTENANTPVSGTVTSNDANGWSVDVESTSTPGNTGAVCGDFVGKANAAPSGGINDFITVGSSLRVQGSTGTQAFTAAQTTPCGQATAGAADTGTSNGTISDVYTLSIPAATAPDTYTTTLNYTIIGN